MFSVAITLVFCVKWSFRNYYNMLILYTNKYVLLFSVLKTVVLLILSDIYTMNHNFFSAHFGELSLYCLLIKLIY